MMLRDAPAASITGSSESLFIAVSVWVMPIARAKGRTTGMMVGRMKVASVTNEPIDWPVSVTRLMRPST